MNKTKIIILFLAGCFIFTGSVLSQMYLPYDVYTTVNGYQDDFEGTSLKPGWQIQGANVYTVSNGVLRVTSASGDPNHLYYAGAVYNNTVQEVLLRMRVVNFGTGDPPRGGASVCIDPSASPAGGINLHFRDNNGRAFAFLDDLRAWGPSYSFSWQNNVWYWVRLRQEPNAASQGGTYDVFGKVWKADGSTPEPDTWQLMWDYVPTRAARTGYAGIAASSSGGLSEFEVDYILIKASGLPQITVTPQSFIQVPVTITNQPRDQIVIELLPAMFEAGVYGVPQPTIQWYRNGIPIPGATNAAYTIPSVKWSDTDSLFYLVAMNVVSNTTYSVTSRVARLIVLPDEEPPEVIGVRSLSFDEVEIIFSEWVAENSATNLVNYRIINSEQIQQSIYSASLLPDGKRVLLKTAPLEMGASYTLYLRGIQDCSSENNQILDWIEESFTAPSYTSIDIGGASPPGSTTISYDRIEIRGGGGNIGGAADQFRFVYQQINGDFDVRVRVWSFSASDVWAKAGLMARESLDAGSRFVAALATPSMNGAFMSCRSSTNGTAISIGGFPLNYPDTWLRLQRSGNVFYAYASMDGARWALLGKTNLSLNSRLYLGFGVSSAIQNTLALAKFKDFSSVVQPLTFAEPMPFEPLGQCSRRTPLVISEVMYNPFSPGAANYEFIEIYNSAPTPEDISNYRLDGDVNYTFAEGTVLQPGGFLVIARKPSDIISNYGITNVVGPYSGSLPNDGGRIRVLNQSGAVMLELNYRTKPPWPVAADGSGHSLVLARPSLGLNDPRAWTWSDRIGGSPGRAESFTFTPLKNVVINEFLASSTGTNVDFIELYNHSNEAVDISGCYLADNRNPLASDSRKFRIPNGTIIPPRGFVTFTQTQMGLALNSAGESIFLWDPDMTMVIDAVKFEGQDAGRSTGRYPDGADEFYPLQTPTPSAPNSQIFVSDVIINEIMYAPISRNSDDEYVEIYNRGTNVVDISGWRFVDGIDYTFPSNTFILPGQYLVVAKNVTNLIAKYPQLNSSNTFGNYSGSLANNGERIALAKWRDVVSTNLLVSSLKLTASQSLASSQTHNFIIPTNADYLIGTNRVYIVVDEVTYGAGGRWGQWSRFGGSSLELIDPRSNKRLPSNWADSDETQKAGWTEFSVSGYADNGTTSAADQLQVLLQGAGECLIDNIEVLNHQGQNLVPNSTFESGASGWVAEGTEESSSWETTEGYQSARSYHVRAVDRGDNQINRIRVNLTSSLQANYLATIRGKVRWLKGHPEILFRIRGCWLEAPVMMNLPKNLGTPGLPNSRLIQNAAPAIYDVAHYPVTPAENENVIVTAKVHDPDGIHAIKLCYRIDPDTNYFAVDMKDDGTGGDGIAGDGVYTAIIPGQRTGAMVAFHIRACDATNPDNWAFFPDKFPTRECLVLFGDSTPSGNFPVYRLWMTQSVFNRWSSRHKLHNAPLPITFVLGNYRAFYHAEGLFAGSPYIAPGFNTPSGNRCGYSIIFQRDEKFLGDTDLVIDWPGGHGGETTAIQEQMAYWLADKLNLPYSYRYFIRLNVNGVTDMQRGGVFEAVLQPGGEYLEQWSPHDPDGDFYKIDRAFEFDDAGNRIADPMPRLELYISADGTKKTAKYRWMWIKRAYDFANNYTNIFHLVEAANATSPEPYTTKMTQLADMEQWMRVFAFEHIINNFDSWGHTIGKNMYAFKPERGKWVLYPFDLDWLMLVSPRGPGGYTATTGPLFVADDPTVIKMYNHPPFRRAYLRAVLDSVDGPLKNAVADQVMDAKYRALVANGITMCDGSTLTDPSAVKTWFNDRRNFLIATLNSNACSFTIKSPTNLYETSTNLLEIIGTAPINVTKIVINGVECAVKWTTLTNWTAYYPLKEQTNNLLISAYDHRGQLVPGSVSNITVYLTIIPPEPQVVITEIMYNPAIPGASFVELYNPSDNFVVDLSGWKLLGVNYKFPQGTILMPNSYLVIAKSRYEAINAYGTNVVIYDEFNGNLRNEGEVLTLTRPGANGDIIVDRVIYEPTKPWPEKANGGGYSLQLIDHTKDNSRVANWSDGDDWRFFSYTGVLTPSTKRLLLYPDAAGELYIDEIKLVVGTEPEVGENLIRGGDFEGPFTTNQGGFWGIYGTAGLQTDVSTNFSKRGNSSLRILFTSPGGPSQYIFQDTLVSATNTYTLSFWYRSSANINKLTARFSSTFRPEVSVSPVYCTPGKQNSISAPMPELPPVWLHEVQAENTFGIRDNFGEREPWIELYNSGTNSVDLSGWALSDDYNNLSKWVFPEGTVINPGSYLIVWCDGELDETSHTNYHANFRLSPTNGSVILSIKIDGKYKPFDYLNYKFLLADYSYGNKQGEQPFFRQKFAIPTPGAPNVSTGSVPPIRINEVMPDNDGLVNDSINGGFPDWFELYNDGPNSLDLSGYFLSDDLNDKFKFEIPDGYILKPFGFLVVWADNSPDRNNPLKDPCLHVNFALNRNGETVALYAPDGALVDMFSFDAVRRNEIIGRYPDGAVNTYKLIQPTPGQTNSLPMIHTNYPPIINVASEYYVSPGGLIRFIIQVTDIDIPQQFITFGISNAPPGASIHPTTGEFVWQVPTDFPISTNIITVFATDDGIPPQTSQAVFRIIVAAVNNPPVIQRIDNLIVDEGQTIRIQVNATDPDVGQSLMFYLDQAPQGAFINPNTGLFEWTPSELQGPGDYTIAIRVMDNGVPQASAVVSFVISVREVNQPPLILSVARQYFYVGEEMNLQIVATDNDVPIQKLFYDFFDVPPVGMTINSTNGTIRWIPDNSYVGTNVIIVRVTDNGIPSLSATQNVEIVVIPPPRIEYSIVGTSKDSLVLSFDSFIGKRYQLLYSDQIGMNWTNFGTALNGTGDKLSVTNSIINPRQRFFKLMIKN